MEYVNKAIENIILTDVDALKYKAIQEYANFIANLESGHKIDYLNILEIISLIDIYYKLDDKRIYYKEFYLNSSYN